VLGTLGLAIIGGFLAKSLRSKAVTNVAATKGILDKKQAKEPVSTSKGEVLVLTTSHGKIRMLMRADLSPESVEYIREIVQSGKCDECKFYRAEKDFLLQGIMKKENAKVKVTKGQCPPGYEEKTDDCPPEQFACGCHGPIMTRGMVGFAAGDTGPDFFIVAYKDPVTDWGTTHTVFGEVKDDASFSVIDKIYTLPATKKGLTMLDEKIDFTLSME